MSKPGREKLRSEALSTLRELGFRPMMDRLPDYSGRSVWRLSKDGVESWYLIQSRHYQSDTSRYLIGVNVDALEMIDYVVMFFEGEPKLLVIPADFLRDIHRSQVVLGNARYTGNSISNGE